MFPREAAGDCRQAVSAHLVWVDSEKVKSSHKVLEVQQGAAFFFFGLPLNGDCVAPQVVRSGFKMDLVVVVAFQPPN